MFVGAGVVNGCVPKSTAVTLSSRQGTGAGGTFTVPTTLPLSAVNAGIALATNTPLPSSAAIMSRLYIETSLSVQQITRRLP